MNDFIVKGGEPKTIDLEDGAYSGKVILLEKRTPQGKDYTYLDITILLETPDELELRVGYALPKGEEGVSPNSELGKLLQRFTGSPVTKEQKYDLQKILDNKQVKLMAVKGDKGYIEVMRGSLKPFMDINITKNRVK